MRFCRYVVLLALPGFVIAQQPGTQDKGKRQPESKPMDVQQQQRREPPLPEIDLPEFVITGSVSIDPPNAQKLLHEGKGIYRRLSSESAIGTRERETLELGQRFKQSQLLPAKNAGGALRAGLGNFFTPDLGASVGLTDPSYDVTGTLSYWRTKGFTRNADASSGMIGVHGSHEIPNGSSFVREARLAAAASLDLRSYRFYGSLLPTTLRDLSRFNLRFQASASVGDGTMLGAGAEFRTISVRDSSTTTTENSVRVDVGGSVPVFEFPLDVHGRMWFSTVTTVAARQLSQIALSVGTPRLSWGNVSMRAGAEGYRLEGMNGQQGSYFFPYVFLDVLMMKRHTAFLSFQPSPVYQTLEDHLNHSPYVSANASIRHTIARLAFTGGIESDWYSWLSTKVWFEHKAMTDYPFYADSTGSGMWLLSYGGTTTVSVFHLDGVANISSNDYFAVTSTMRVDKSTATEHVPYLPGFEASFAWTHRFGFEVDVSPSVGVVSRQDVDFVGSQGGAHVWTGLHVEYLGLGNLKIFLNATNLLNQKYEVWKGYRAEPFRVAAGLTYRW
ncbi:MAG TPA: hypothetical protein VJN65_01215 [Bacteroidota bacterium]|nr:hypothetical protein [Bacteroidota bacterium]